MLHKNKCTCEVQIASNVQKRMQDAGERHDMCENLVAQFRNKSVEVESMAGNHEFTEARTLHDFQHF